MSGYPADQVLSPHLFNAQMGKRSLPELNIRPIVSARYRSEYPCSIFPTHTTYTPPALPVHIPVKLEPISGQPSQEEIIRVQNAIRSYQKLTDIPSLFDPKVNAELNQHLFDIQMGELSQDKISIILLIARSNGARYMERCTHANPVPQSAAPAEPTGSGHPVEPVNEETNRATNNAGRATDVVDAHQTVSSRPNPIIRDVIERSNQLAERSNQLIERSNLIAEQLARAVEQSSQLTEKVTELFGQLERHFEQSNRLAEASTKPAEKLGDVLKNINGVLVGIQHAIVRNHKGNTSEMVDCLINGKGDTDVTGTDYTFSSISKIYSGKSDCHLPVVVNGLSRDCFIPDFWLGNFLHFFSIGHGLLQSGESVLLKEGCAGAARKILSNYLSSRLRSLEEKRIAKAPISKSAASSFSDVHTTYTPPALPVHIPAKLEPISGQPSQEEIIRVQNAIRSYQKLTDIPSLFDPQVNAELNQHLFDIQMALYMERCTHANPVPQSAAPAEPTSPGHLVEPVNEETNRAINNAGRATDVVDAHQIASRPDPIIHDVIERSNQLAERSNQLIERSNQIAEQLARAVEQSSQPNEQSSKLTEKVTELFGQLERYFEQANRLAEASTKPVEKLGDVLKNINGVLVGIQHAIVRNHKGNTSEMVDCLINGKGDTDVTGTEYTFSSISKIYSGKSDCHLPVVVDGLSRDCFIPDFWLGNFLHFFSIGHGLLQSGESVLLKEGCAGAARKILSNHLSSRLR
ncbi:hypothetical protein RSAG8_10755, partial [Rhizoctonia solani AG-8 WAC10335]